MKRSLPRFVYLLFLLSLLNSEVAIAQKSPPRPRISPDQPKSAASTPEERSLVEFQNGEVFYYQKGDFSIGFPESVGGAPPPAKGGDNEQTHGYIWVFKEGMIMLHCENFRDPGPSLNSEKEYQEFFEKHKNAALTRSNAKLTSEGPLKSGEYKGWGFTFQMTDGSSGFARDFYANKREYTLIAFVKKGVEGAEGLISRGLDSFRPESPNPVLPREMQKMVEDKTPTAFPQETRAKKERSDLEDDNLKGRVKKIVHDSEPVNSDRGRHFSWIDEFDLQGNKVRSVSFDWRYRPQEITVYGFLEGARVSKSVSLSYPDDLPGPPGIAMPSSGKPDDPRYKYKFVHRYENGRLVEEQHLQNNGDLWLKNLYSYDGPRMELMVFGFDGKLNQHYVYTLDERGNEVEKLDRNVLKLRSPDDLKWVTTYDLFDKKGNWIRKTESKVLTEIGGRLIQAYYIEHRTITYYE